MGDLATKREREKQVVSQMIALYCRKKAWGQKTALPGMRCADRYARQRSDRCPLWRRKPFAPTAGCIVTGQICGSRFAR